jgi:hypothetical protein
MAAERMAIYNAKPPTIPSWKMLRELTIDESTEQQPIAFPYFPL